MLEKTDFIFNWSKHISIKIIFVSSISGINDFMFFGGSINYIVFIKANRHCVIECQINVSLGQ